MSIQCDTLPLISCLYVLYISQLLYTSKFLLLYLEESFPHPPSCIHSEMIPFTLNGLLKFSITKAEDSTHICISIGCMYVSMCQTFLNPYSSFGTRIRKCPCYSSSYKTSGAASSDCMSIVRPCKAHVHYQHDSLIFRVCRSISWDSTKKYSST